MYLKFIKKGLVIGQYLGEKHAKVIVQIIGLMKLPGEREKKKQEDNERWSNLSGMQRFKRS